MKDDVITRFNKKFAPSLIEGGCWEWTGAKNAKGYGHMSRNYRADRQYAHRVSYEIFYGPIPKDLTIDHLCENKGCVNPAHLEAVTLKENISRSDGISAMNARKVYCLRGHVLAEGNLIKRKNGWRECKTCAYLRRKKK